MASNLAGGVCIAELQACVVRAARLDSDCTPTQGTNGGIVTAGIVTLTADPIIEEGKTYEQPNGCGSILYTVTKDDKLKGQTLSGEFGFSDFEMMALLFGGDVILGKGGGEFAGEVIGYADPLYNAPPRSGVYLEVITNVVEEGAGDCITSGSARPVAIGHIFGKAKLTQGSKNFADDVRRITFTGKGTNNPNLFDGPWNDFPGAGWAPNTSYFTVGYSQTEYDAILGAVTCGYVDLEVAS
jgi:hypothetical protein